MSACQQCGREIAADALRLGCPRCALTLALADEAEPPPPPFVGDYELEPQPLGRGGMGEVYRARGRFSDAVVALKMVSAGAWASRAALDAFREEVRRATRLRHENIVPVFHAGEDDGLPYFTMQLMEGGTLAELGGARPSPEQAAEWVARLAEAAQYGHDRGIAHRDIKPANILFADAARTRPMLADFGIATPLRPEGEAQPEAAGTLPYMAPETLRGERIEDFGAVDVYGLGAVLYELLAGRPPFAAPDVERLRERILHDPPERLGRAVPSTLERVCGRCLARDPRDRYGSARDLAEDLWSFLRGQETRADPWPVWRRASKWLGGHVPQATALAVALGAASVVALVALAAQSRHAQALRDNTLRNNAWIAEGAANTVLVQFRDCAQAMEAVAADPRLAEVFSSTEPARLLGEIVRAHHGEGFSSWLVVDARRTVVARLPQPLHEEQEKILATRDYVLRTEQRAAEGLRGVYVSRAFESIYDQHKRKVAFAAPLFDAQGRYLATVAATLASDRTLERLRVPNDSDRRIVVAAPSETGGYCALVHPELRSGEWLPLDAAPVRQFERFADDRAQLALAAVDAPLTDEHFRDPGDGAREWLAGFAPVGRTGYGVIVETPRGAGPALITREVALSSGAALAGLAALSILVTLADGRRRAAKPGRRRG